MTPKINNADISTDSYSNYSNSNNQKNKSKIKNLEQVDKEYTFTTKGYTGNTGKTGNIVNYTGNKLISHRGTRGGSVLKTTFNSKFENLEKNGNDINNLRESHSSIKTTSVVSGVSGMSGSVTSRNNNTNKRVELFDDKNKMANLYKFRKDRREILKATMGGKLNSRPDLFKFDVNTQLKDMSNNDNRFMELLQMPKKLLDHIDETQHAPSNRDSPNKGSAKNTIRKRIEDAVNFSKSKN
jgi:hypothetical protein